MIVCSGVNEPPSPFRWYVPPELARSHPIWSGPGTVAAVAFPLPSTSTKDALDDDTDPGLVVVSSVKNRSLIFWPTLFTWAAVKRLVRSMVTVPAPVVMVADAATASPED